MKQWKSLLIFVAICFSVQAVASWCTFQTVTTWYPTLTKPEWRPPNWLFGPVWTVLYFMMAIAAWRVWIQKSQHDIAIPLTVFFIQLLFNLLWSIFFFSFNLIGTALLDIVILWGLIAATGVLFWRVETIAGGLIFLYWMWVSYATALNFSIWRLNP